MNALNTDIKNELEELRNKKEDQRRRHHAHHAHHNKRRETICVNPTCIEHSLNADNYHQLGRYFKKGECTISDDVLRQR